MPRTAALTYDDFLTVARDILAGGRKLTFASVRAATGGGSYEVIRRYLDRFAAEAPLRGEGGTVPENLMGGMQALFDQARVAALSQVRAELTHEAATLAAERSEFSTQRDTLLQLAAGAEARAEVNGAAVDEMGRALDMLRTRLDQALAEREEIQRLRISEAGCAAEAAARASQEFQDQAHAFVTTVQTAQSDARDARHQLLGFKDELREALKRADSAGQALAAIQASLKDQASAAATRHTEACATAAAAERRILALLSANQLANAAPPKRYRPGLARQARKARL
jgi:chromosome segregation ATPase